MSIILSHRVCTIWLWQPEQTDTQGKVCCLTVKISLVLSWFELEETLDIRETFSHNYLQRGKRWGDM